MHDRFLTPAEPIVLRVLCFGDIVANTGCALFQKYAQKIKKEYSADIIIVNGENAASQGRGITPKIVASLKHCGANIITGGNHSFAHKDAYSVLEEKSTLLRPANYPSACPGTGVGLFNYGSIKIGVINVQGRVFMHQHLDCPFKVVDSALTYLKSQTNIIIVDMHAEATSEKIGLAHHVDGKVSTLFGTHTHVQTADERILPGGCAYISDLGMIGALNGMIGMKKESVLPHLLTQMPSRFEPDDRPPYVVSGIVVDIDKSSGKALAIARVYVTDEEALHTAPQQQENR